MMFLRFYVQTLERFQPSELEKRGKSGKSVAQSGFDG